MRRRSKYGAVRTTVDGIAFASKAEARRYRELRLLERAGEIRDLELQPAINLDAPGGPARVGVYRADFRYYRRTPAGWADTWEDVKGVMTPLCRWKLAHVKAQYGMDVQIVRAR